MIASEQRRAEAEREMRNRSYDEDDDSQTTMLVTKANGRLIGAVASTRILTRKRHAKESSLTHS